MDNNDFTFPTLAPPKETTNGEKISDKAAFSAKPGKVALSPGYSQISWMSKCQKNKFLGIGNIPFDKNMKKEDIAKHNSVEDAWIIVHHKVYNLTPYLPYHPGGVDILQGVLGKDATSLFEKYHPWVNVDALLQACWLGVIQS